MWIWMLFGLVGIGLLVVAYQSSRAGYASAPYTIVRSDGPVELRDYPALRVVETPMAAGIRGGGDGSFGRLFRFISGGNDARMKFAMTTPVFMARGEGKATMAFVLPAKFGPDEVPRPSDGRVSVRELDAGRFAVLRFRGGRSALNEAAAVARLELWAAAQRVSVLSPPLYGYFDPPWTPTFLRRNEVMLRIASEP